MANKELITNLKPVGSKYGKKAGTRLKRFKGHAARSTGLASGLSEEAIKIFKLAKKQQEARKPAVDAG